MKKSIDSIFRNEERMDALYQAFQNQDCSAIRRLVCADDHANLTLCKKIHHKKAKWETLKEDTVYKVTYQQEIVVIKLFSVEQEFPFHEICGNIVAFYCLKNCPFFVRTLDIGKVKDHYTVVMEYLDTDTETIDLDQPINMYNFFYQTAYALVELQKACQLSHFDLRYDNIMIKKLVEPRDLFKNGIDSNFIVKIGDFGQCEFDFGDTRIPNIDIPRELEYRRKWGIYPTEFSGYDFQYMLATLTPILDNLHGISYYYIYSMLIDFLEPIECTNAQHRPVIITTKKPMDILKFLKTKVSVTLN
jgi:serine/threonine protein kinase